MKKCILEKGMSLCCCCHVSDVDTEVKRMVEEDPDVFADAEPVKKTSKRSRK